MGGASPGTAPVAVGLTVAAWILITGAWALRESVKYFLDWLRGELRRRKELRARLR
jgi:hypothetical protein